MAEKYEYYYEEDGFTLHAQDRVWYTQCGIDGKLTLFELLKRTTDISTEDFRLRGMSMPYLSEKGYARVVSRSSFRIHRMPVCNERIEIITCEEKPEPLQIIQTYEFKSEQGESLVSAESAWMIIDVNTRRIVPTKQFTLRVPNTARLSHDCLPNGRIARPENLLPLESFTVRPSMLDGNGHADNAWYATFIEDSLPKEYQGRTPRDFRINYSKELFLGENIETLASFNEEQNKVVIIGQKKASAEKAADLSFESEIFF